MSGVSRFLPTAAVGNTLRLNFATASLEDIEVGIGRLGVLFNENI